MFMPTPCRPTERIWRKSCVEATSQTNAQDAFSTEGIKTMFMHKRTIVIILYATMELKTTLTLLFVHVSFCFCFFCCFLFFFFSSKFCSFDYLFIRTKRYRLIGTWSMRLNSQRGLRCLIARLRVKKLAWVTGFISRLCLFVIDTPRLCSCQKRA